MKQCRNCKQTKSLESFFKDAGLSDGHANTCKECKQNKTYAWREKNKDKYNAYMRERNKHHYPEYRLKRYGKTDAWFKETLKEQGNVCAICRKPNSSTKRTFAVDHHHDSGKVRGIICYNCNRLLHAFDNLDLFNSIVSYLNKHKETT